MNVVRKIGYSFLGLLAGDAALLVSLMWMLGAWDTSHLELIVFYLLLFTFPGWIVVGIPAVLLMDVQLLRRLRWVLVILIGSALGALAWFLLWFSSFLFSGPHHHLNLAGHWGWSWAEWLGILLAMLVSTVAFAVYCALARRTSLAQ